MEILDEDNFKEKTSKGLVVVDFFANWCGPCRMMSPILQEVQADMGEKVKIYKVNVDFSAELAKEYKIVSIPALFVLKDGKTVHTHIGLWEKEEMEETLNSLL